jgi:hypothetical protein
VARLEQERAGQEQCEGDEPPAPHRNTLAASSDPKRRI